MSRIKKILKLLCLSPTNLFYVRRMRKSGLFDRQFYLGANPGLHKIFHYFPERHYLLVGEKSGLYPNPDFSPKAYLRHNPDLRKLKLAPFDHYLRTGCHENRLTKDLPDNSRGSRRLPRLCKKTTVPAKYAIVAHLYYHELWEEFANTLQAQDFKFDLFVTLTYKGEETDQLVARIRAKWPQALVTTMPNRGRDIFPFVHLVNSGLLQGYQAVCKIHSKKSPHRQDGDHWRQHLISGILLGTETEALLQRFCNDPEAGIWVADGQHYNDPQWWGSNFDRVQELMQTIEVSVRKKRLSFPAGSMYWLKPQLLDLLRGLQLTVDSFDPEKGQTDGTLAHCLERGLGMMVDAAGLQIRQTDQLAKAKDQPVATSPKPRFTSAFYLPQFHPTPQNDAWWGKGFTEWTATTRARPNFVGQAHPVMPADLGFYDLRATEVLGQQAALARDVGIDAFCVYHYWFDGNRILEAPIDKLLQRPDIDFPFYLCWANESWRRNWDGLSGEVLMPQSYAPGFAAELAQSLLPYFNDPRYQRPDGSRPRFMIYRPEDMPDPAAAVAEMRDTWRQAGIGEIELGAVLFHIEGDNPVATDLFDFWVEMPPHGMVGGSDYLYGGMVGNKMQSEVAGDFSGLIYDYTRLRHTSSSKHYISKLPEHTIAGVMPSWDNTARRDRAAHIAYGANPATFELWLRDLLQTRIAGSYRQELFINSWNEWAEKAMLEPSQQYQTAYLDALKRVLCHPQ
ncbi:glycosyl transferase family 1 [Rhodobacterales bacterium 56_14_T64]|nr:glycosyl transferase family 1 [Rhodobacterales bacterium 56_14_T64]